MGVPGWQILFATQGFKEEIEMPVIDNKYVRWNPNVHSPSERCEGTVATGQCPFCKIQGTNYCYTHGANKKQESDNAKAIRNYRLQRWQSRVGELADNPNIKSLREEVGILRVILEEMLNQCKDSMDLLLYSHKMSDLVMKIERLVVSCDKLENRMGLLLSKDSILQLAATYVQIINNYVQNPELIELISQEMLVATDKIQDPTNA